MSRMQANMTAETTRPLIELTQADRIIAKFGGPTALCRALKAIGKPKDRVTIWRWNQPRSNGGSDGIIPTGALPDVLEAARAFGILITPQDMDPRSTLKRKYLKNTGKKGPHKEK